MIENLQEWWQTGRALVHEHDCFNRVRRSRCSLFVGIGVKRRSRRRLSFFFWCLRRSARWPMVDGAEPAQLVWWIVVAPWHPAQLYTPHPRQRTKWCCLLSFFGAIKFPLTREQCKVAWWLLAALAGACHFFAEWAGTPTNKHSKTTRAWNPNSLRPAIPSKARSMMVDQVPEVVATT